MADRTTPQDAADLARLLAERGPLDPVQPVPPGIVTAYEGRVPGILLDLWEDRGVGDLLGGRIKLCVPTELSGAVEYLFRGDPDFGAPPAAGPDAPRRATDVHAIAHGPFGELLLWSERHGLVQLMVRLGLVEASFLHRPATAPRPDAAILDFVLGADPAVFDLADEDGVPMFDRARSAYGPRGRLEIYAPGIAQGGMGTPPRVETLIPAPYRPWLEGRIVASVWRLSDLATGRMNIRRIGGAP